MNSNSIERKTIKDIEPAFTELELSQLESLRGGSDVIAVGGSGGGGGGGGLINIVGGTGGSGGVVGGDGGDAALQITKNVGNPIVDVDVNVDVL